MYSPLCFLFFFFFNDTATTEIYTLSLHDALPIYGGTLQPQSGRGFRIHRLQAQHRPDRSEEHTSELQSQSNLVCRLLLEKKKKWKTGEGRPPLTWQSRPPQCPRSPRRPHSSSTQP